MRVEINDDKIIIYYFDKIDSESYVEDIISLASSRYNLKIYGFVTVNVYKDDIIILELIRNSISCYDYDELDLHIVYKKNKILYEIDDIDELSEVFTHNNKLYTNKRGINNCEFIKIIYNDTD